MCTCALLLLFIDKYDLMLRIVQSEVIENSADCYCYITELNNRNNKGAKEVTP